jgi:hypothetical protein
LLDIPRIFAKLPIANLWRFSLPRLLCLWRAVTLLRRPRIWLGYSSFEKIARVRLRLESHLRFLITTTFWRLGNGQKPLPKVKKSYLYPKATVQQRFCKRALYGRGLCYRQRFLKFRPQSYITAAETSKWQRFIVI